MKKFFQRQSGSELFYYGWVIVIVAMVSLAFWFGFRTMFSVFLVALVEEFKWGRAEISGVQSVAMILYIVTAPIVGGLLDRFGPRRVIVPGIVLLAVGIGLCATIRRLLDFYVFFGVVAGIGVTFVSMVPYMAIIPHWFQRRRGLASGIASSGLGLGVVVFVPLSQALISEWGWRLSFMILAVATIVILLPLNGLFLRYRPQEKGYDGPDGDPGTKEGSSAARNQSVPSRPSYPGGIKDAMKTVQFWSLMIFPMLSMIGVYVLSVHFVSFLVGRGMDRMMAASAFALIGIISTPFRILWGFISDRIGREKAYTVGLLIFCSSFYCLFQFEQTGNVWLVYLFTVIIGIGWGVTGPMFMASAADLFHGPIMGRVSGLLEGSVGVGGAFGAWVGGYLFDKTGSYLWAFGIAVIAGLLSCVFMWTAAPRRGTVPMPEREGLASGAS
jgi:MFS family permease